MSRSIRNLLLLLLILLTAAACGGSPTPAATEQTIEITEVTSPTASPAPPEPTATTAAPVVIVLAPEDSRADIQSTVEAQVAALSAERGMRWQIRQQMTADEIATEANFVIALPPQPDLNALVAGAPSVRFLAVDIPGTEPAPNLILIRTPEGSAEVESFMGGYIGALMTEDWRIGIITVEDGSEQQRFTAFENGMRFFCGLCRPQYAPFYEYPFKLSLPATASDVEWRALAEFMRDRLVRTVYVSPGAANPTLLATLASLDVYVIGSTPPPAGLESGWVASLRVEPDTAYESYIPRLLDGETDLVITLPIEIRDANAQLFGGGKQRLAEQTLTDLLEGYILPGDLP